MKLVITDLSTGTNHILDYYRFISNNHKFYWRLARSNIVLFVLMID